MVEHDLAKVGVAGSSPPGDTKAVPLSDFGARDNKCIETEQNGVCSELTI